MEIISFYCSLILPHFSTVQNNAYRKIGTLTINHVRLSFPSGEWRCVCVSATFPIKKQKSR